MVPIIAWIQATDTHTTPLSHRCHVFPLNASEGGRAFRNFSGTFPELAFEAPAPCSSKDAVCVVGLVGLVGLPREDLIEAEFVLEDDGLGGPRHAVGDSRSDLDEEIEPNQTKDLTGLGAPRAFGIRLHLRFLGLEVRRLGLGVVQLGGEEHDKHGREKAPRSGILCTWKRRRR